VHVFFFFFFTISAQGQVLNTNLSMFFCTLPSLLTYDKQWRIQGAMVLLPPRDVHGNGKDWDPMGPMGFPWEWE